MPIIAKIELAQAYSDLDRIIDEAFGVMIARGDLGVQLPLERIPLIQADILERANAAGRISITATEMLESMTRSPRPTRAEVTDVATAVQSGTDAVMLSGETAVGDYPIQAVAAMAEICRVVEGGTLSGRGDQPVPFVGRQEQCCFGSLPGGHPGGGQRRCENHRGLHRIGKYGPAAFQVSA